MIQENKSGTLGCNNDQTLFQPKVFGICSKDSNAMKSDNPNSGFYEADTSRTLDANGGNPNCNQGGMAVVAYNGVSITSKTNASNPKIGDPCHSLTTDDRNYVVSIQGSMIGREDKNGPAGSGVGEDVSFTLNTVDRHGVAYGIDRAAFNQGKNAKYDISIEEEKNSSLVAKGPSAVAYCARPGNHIANAVGVECSPPEADRDYKDPLITANNIDYIVRRLTPTECGRLQGFPDWWCEDLAIPNPTDEELKFWDKVFREWGKPKTEKQIRKWLADPHTDSAEYKMWGNGCALPNVYYVLFGIAEELKRSGDV